MGIFLSYFVWSAAVLPACRRRAAAFEADALLKKLSGSAKHLNDAAVGKAVASYRTPKAPDLQATMSNF